MAGACQYAPAHRRSITPFSFLCVANYFLTFAFLARAADP